MKNRSNLCRWTPPVENRWNAAAKRASILAHGRNDGRRTSMLATAASETAGEAGTALAHQEAVKAHLLAAAEHRKAALDRMDHGDKEGSGRHEVLATAHHRAAREHSKEAKAKEEAEPCKCGGSCARCRPSDFTANRLLKPRGCGTPSAIRNRMGGKVVRRNGHLFVPVSMIRADTVMSGSDGPLIYPAGECARTAGQWNNIPITHGHPTESLTNRNLSARDPAAAGLHLGRVVGAHFKNGKTRATAMINERKLKRLAPGVHAALLAGSPVEVSTGLHVSQEPGQDGRMLAMDHRPDHLAILQWDRGSCDNSMGCGLNVNSTFTTNTFIGGITMSGGPFPAERDFFGTLDRLKPEGHDRYVMNMTPNLVESDADYLGHQTEPIAGEDENAGQGDRPPSGKFKRLPPDQTEQNMRKLGLGNLLGNGDDDDDDDDDMEENEDKVDSSMAGAFGQGGSIMAGGSGTVLDYEREDTEPGDSAHGRGRYAKMHEGSNWEDAYIPPPPRPGKTSQTRNAMIPSGINEPYARDASQSPKFQRFLRGR